MKMAEHPDMIQDIILEKIEKLLEEPGKEIQIKKWSQVLAWYGEAKR
jgi:hypothetical protein